MIFDGGGQNVVRRPVEQFVKVVSNLPTNETMICGNDNL